MEETNFEQFKKEIMGKKVAVLGLGVSNIPAIEYLHKLGAILYAHDMKETLSEACEKLTKLDQITFVLGEECFQGLNEMDYLLRSPGVKPFLPQIEEAIAHGVILTSEIELFLQFCPCPIIGVTGSAGKTTVTTLVSKLLEDAKYHVWMGGNIGIPLFTKLDDIKSSDIAVLELSSFQLMSAKVSPHISLITNIYEDHLDYHRSFEEYVLAKTNIFSHQKTGDICVLNADSPFTKQFMTIREEENIANDMTYFSTEAEQKNGAYIRENIIYRKQNDKEDMVVATKDVMLQGMKNYGNICSAICAVSSYVTLESMQKTLKEFKGVEHRLEYVDTKHGVSYYNDSISTTPGKASAALCAFEQPIILIAGGSDKNLDYSDFGKEVVRAAKCLVLLGNTSQKIKEATLAALEDKQSLPIIEVSSLGDAIKEATTVAKEGDIVVMSPASASFDMYHHYKERGQHFKTLVKEI